MWQTFPIAFVIATLYGTTIFALSILAALLYPSFGWELDHIAIAAAFISAFQAIFMCGLVMCDVAWQRRQPGHDRDDIAYYPRLRQARQWWKSFAARWTLILGVLLILYRNTNLITAHRYRAVIVQDTGSPEMQIVISMLCLYGLMWIADCLIRPNRGTIVAAAAFNLLNWFVLFQPFVGSEVRY